MRAAILTDGAALKVLLPLRVVLTIVFMLKHLLIVGIICSAILSCNHKPQIKSDILLEHIDTTVSPATDFFGYANGGWIKKNPIPADQSSWGIVELVNDENLSRLKELNEKASKANAKEGTTEQKIRDFWNTAMDSSKIEDLGLKPLQPYIEKINAISDIRSLMTISAELKNTGSITFFVDGPSPDDMNSDRMIYKLWQGGIGLPEREYYFKSDSATINIRNEYVKYIFKILTLSGEDPATAAKSADDILAVETKLARASRKKEDLRDPHKNYNKVSVGSAKRLFFY